MKKIIYLSLIFYAQISYCQEFEPIEFYDAKIERGYVEQLIDFVDDDQLAHDLDMDRAVLDLKTYKIRITSDSIFINVYQNILDDPAFYVVASIGKKEDMHNLIAKGASSIYDQTSYYKIYNGFPIFQSENDMMTFGIEERTPNKVYHGLLSIIPYCDETNGKKIIHLDVSPDMVKGDTSRMKKKMRLSIPCEGDNEASLNRLEQLLRPLIMQKSISLNAKDFVTKLFGIGVVYRESLFDYNNHELYLATNMEPKWKSMFRSYNPPYPLMYLNKKITSISVSIKVTDPIEKIEGYHYYININDKKECKRYIESLLQDFAINGIKLRKLNTKKHNIKDVWGAIYGNCFVKIWYTTDIHIDIYPKNGEAHMWWKKNNPFLE